MNTCCCETSTINRRTPRELAKLLHGRQAHVNLIPFNDVEGLPYRRLTQQALTDFVAILRERRHQREGAQAQGRRHRRGLRTTARAAALAGRG